MFLQLKHCKTINKKLNNNIAIVIIYSLILTAEKSNMPTTSVHKITRKFQLTRTYGVVYGVGRPRSSCRGATVRNESCRSSLTRDHDVGIEWF